MAAINNNSSTVVVGRTAPVPAGQQTSAKSIPVVIASDQSAIPVEEQNKQQSEVALSLLGIPRSEVALGIFADVNTYDVNPTEWTAFPEQFTSLEQYDPATNALYEKYSGYGGDQDWGLTHIAEEAGAMIEAPSDEYSILTSKRFFRYQPGRVSAATFGVKLNRGLYTISKGDPANKAVRNPTIKKYGIFDKFDGYYYESRNDAYGDNFACVRRTQSIIRDNPLPFSTTAGYQTEDYAWVGVAQVESNAPTYPNAYQILTANKRFLQEVAADFIAVDTTDAAGASDTELLGTETLDGLDVADGGTAPSYYTPTSATYNPATGELVLTIGIHSHAVGDTLVLEAESLGFTCDSDGNTTTKYYPRASGEDGRGIGSSRSDNRGNPDPAYNNDLTIRQVSSDTVTVNVGTSSDTAAHTWAGVNPLYTAAGTESAVAIYTVQDPEWDKCRRDAGLIIEGLLHDIKYGGNASTVYNTYRFFNRKDLDDVKLYVDDSAQEIARYDVVRKAISDILGRSQVQFFTPSAADYEPANGNLTLTIGTHSLVPGLRIQISPNSLGFTCSTDGFGAIKLYPRVSGENGILVNNQANNNVGQEDPAYLRAVEILETTSNTITVNVGRSSDAVLHTPVVPAGTTAREAVYTPSTGVIELEIGPHNHVVGDSVTLDEESLGFTCALDGSINTLGAITQTGLYNPTLYTDTTPPAGGTAAVVKVNTNGSGVITDVELVFRGEGYTTSDSITFAGNGGTASIPVTAVYGPHATTKYYPRRSGSAEPGGADPIYATPARITEVTATTIKFNVGISSDQSVHRLVSADTDSLRVYSGHQFQSADTSAVKAYRPTYYTPQVPGDITGQEAAYNPTSGLLTLEIGPHSIEVGSSILLQTESLGLSCDYTDESGVADNFSTVKLYPRASGENKISNNVGREDLAYKKGVRVVEVPTSTSIIVDVGKSSDTTTHRFVSAAANSVIVYAPTAPHYSDLRGFFASGGATNTLPIAEQGAYQAIANLLSILTTALQGAGNYSSIPQPTGSAAGEMCVYRDGLIMTHAAAHDPSLLVEKTDYYVYDLFDDGYDKWLRVKVPPGSSGLQVGQNCYFNKNGNTLDNVVDIGADFIDDGTIWHIHSIRDVISDSTGVFQDVRLSLNPNNEEIYTPVGGGNVANPSNPWGSNEDKAYATAGLFNISQISFGGAPTNYTGSDIGNTDKEAYNPATGLLTLNIGPHTHSPGDFVSLAAESLGFKCLLDGKTSTKYYPRASGEDKTAEDPNSNNNVGRPDPAYNTPVKILSVTGTTITIDVGISSNASDHDFVGYNTALTGTIITITPGVRGAGFSLQTPTPFLLPNDARAYKGLNYSDDSLNDNPTAYVDGAFPYLYPAGASGDPNSVGYIDTTLQGTGGLPTLQQQINYVNKRLYKNWVWFNVDPRYYKVYEYRVPRSRMSGEKLNGVTTDVVYSDNVLDKKAGDPVEDEVTLEQIEFDSVWDLDPTKVTMYKIEFSWYGAVGATFLAYVPVENNEARWVRVHHLRASNQLKVASLGNATLPITYMVYGGGSKNRYGYDNLDRLANTESGYGSFSEQLVKYGASYYIDGGDRGTVRLFSYASETLKEIGGSKYLISGDVADNPDLFTYSAANKLNPVPGSSYINAFALKIDDTGTAPAVSDYYINARVVTGNANDQDVRVIWAKPAETSTYVGSQISNTATDAYDPATGLLTLDIGEHDHDIGDRVLLANNSLVFTCDYNGDGQTTEKSYPRLSGEDGTPGGANNNVGVEDPAYQTEVEILEVTSTTITINVGISSDTSTHQFVGYNSTGVNGVTYAAGDTIITINAGPFLYLSRALSATTGDISLVVDRPQPLIGIKCRREINGVRNRVQIYPTRLATGVTSLSESLVVQLIKSPLFQTYDVPSSDASVGVDSAINIGKRGKKILLPKTEITEYGTYLQDGESTYGYFRYTVVGDTSGEASTMLGLLEKEGGDYYFSASEVTIDELNIRGKFLRVRNWSGPGDNSNDPDLSSTVESPGFNGFFTSTLSRLSAVQIDTEQRSPIPGTGTTVTTLFSPNSGAEFNLQSYFDYNKDYLSFPLTDLVDSLYICASSKSFYGDNNGLGAYGKRGEILASITWEEQ